MGCEDLPNWTPQGADHFSGRDRRDELAAPSGARDRRGGDRDAVRESATSFWILFGAVEMQCHSTAQLF